MSIRQTGKSLSIRKNHLANPAYQLDVLNSEPLISGLLPFAEKLKSEGIEAIKPFTPEILQINIGKKCNQSCAHCHVDAGPDRIEQMSKDLLVRCIEILEQYNIPTVDITGGAPELHPEFRWFVSLCSALNKHVIDRCNLTIIVANSKYHDLPDFFAANHVHLVCSLPHFSKLRTDNQRGDGVFEDSIRALKMLNDVGYGHEGSNLTLDLVHNPSGAFLPGDQGALESEFKSQLKRKYGIQFNSLYSITNLPISRFLDYLVESGNEHDYMQTLVQSFNPATISKLMCRNTINVSWDGFLYDCDFNQMLDLKIASTDNHISSFNLDSLLKRSVVVNQHCYGCTAGSGSSCGGTLL